MMDHRQAEALLPDYEAGRLDRERTRALHAHFKACEACQARIRIRRAALGAQARSGGGGLTDPETQRQMAGNRDLLIKILLLLVAAWAVYKWHR